MPENVMDITELSEFQRKQMDLNHDYFFSCASEEESENVVCAVDSYAPPCPSGGSDILYLMRYEQKLYAYLDPMNSLAYLDENLLYVFVQIYM